MKTNTHVSNVLYHLWVGGSRYPNKFNFFFNNIVLVLIVLVLLEFVGQVKLWALV